jgi:hypothetical protein
LGLDLGGGGGSIFTGSNLTGCLSHGCGGTNLVESVIVGEDDFTGRNVYSNNKWKQLE